MRRRMTRAEARAWKARWLAVNQVTAREKREASPERRFLRMLACRAMVRRLGLSLDRQDAGEVERVRERWLHLKESSGGLPLERDRILDALESVAILIADGIPGVVIGGIAATILGNPRLTTDVDAILMPEAEDLDDLVQRAGRVGLVPRVDDAARFAERHGVLLMKHAGSGTEVDISLGALPFEAEMIRRAVTMEVAGIRFPVPTAEDFVVMKAVARRPVDLADIEAVLAANPETDLRRVRRWVRRFADVLKAPEMLDDLEKAIRRVRELMPRRRSR